MIKGISLVLVSALLLISLCSCTESATDNKSGSTEYQSYEEQSETAPDTQRVYVGSDSSMHLVYQNDFSSDMEAINVLYGSFAVRDGRLVSATQKTGGYSTLLFDIGEYSDFVYEADFLSHAAGGGLIFLCDGEKSSKNSSDAFCGYMAYIGREGGLGALGCATNDGKWSGNISVSSRDVTDAGSDLHLRVRVSGNYIIYTVTDIKSGAEVYRYEYIKGDNTKYDTTPNDRGMIGLRMYNDGGVGGFDNVRLYAKKDIDVSGSATLTSGMVMNTEVTAAECEEFVTLTDNDVGYALSYDASVERVFLYKYDDGKLTYIAEYALSLTCQEKYPLSVRFGEGALSFYFGDMTYPVFEIPSDADSFCVGASNRLELEFSKSEELPSAKWYINPIADGADPEVVYYDGVYYLYTSHNKKVRVRTSTDLVNWQEAGYAFTLDVDSTITSFMSPNVFYKDGLFYLIIASRIGGSTSSTDFKLYYASSASPTGPFVMKGDRPYINETNEIGGAPFIDEDGRIYITTVRFGGGNNIYIQEISAKDGTITPVSDAVHCISPTEHYEIDMYGKITEGGVIVKHDGYYYMMYASGHYKGHYGEAYAVSKSLTGPWEKYKYNDVLSSTVFADGVGDCVFVRSTAGELFVMYHRHTDVGNEGKDRSICLDRVYFIEASDEGEPDILCVFGPTVTKQLLPSAE